MKKNFTFTLGKANQQTQKAYNLPFTLTFKNPTAFCFSGVEFRLSSGHFPYYNDLEKVFLACLKLSSAHGHIYTIKCKIDSQWEAAAQHREISSVLCDHLEGWDREGGKEEDARGKRYGDICIHIADSLCDKPETNTPL